MKRAMIDCAEKICEFEKREKEICCCLFGLINIEILKTRYSGFIVQFNRGKYWSA